MKPDTNHTLYYVYVMNNMLDIHIKILTLVSATRHKGFNVDIDIIWVM